MKQTVSRQHHSFTLFIITTIVLAFALASCGDNSTASADKDKTTAGQAVKVKGAYIRAMPPGQKVTAMFMELDNPSPTDHALVAAKGNVSEAIELHEHTHENGVMRMRQVEKIAIPANGKAMLQPGGYHVMLIGLKENLKPGDQVAIQLEFEDGSTQDIKSEVKSISAE